MTVTKTPVSNGNKSDVVKPVGAKKISLACGIRPPEGFFGVDIAPECNPDLVWDLLQYPWPIKTNCAEEISCEHYVEHIPHYRPWFTKDGFFHFADELHRICKKDAVVTIVHPYVMNGRAFWDPTHERFIHEATWTYLDRGWRLREGLDHYDTVADFEVIAIDGVGIDDGASVRNPEQQTYMRNHYWNVVQDLVVKLKARK